MGRSWPREGAAAKATNRRASGMDFFMGSGAGKRGLAGTPGGKGNGPGAEVQVNNPALFAPGLPEGGMGGWARPKGTEERGGGTAPVPLAGRQSSRLAYGSHPPVAWIASISSLRVTQAATARRAASTAIGAGSGSAQR